MRYRVFVFVLLAVLLGAGAATAGEVRLLDSPCRLLDTRNTSIPSATGYSIKARGNPGPGGLQGGQSGCGAPIYAEGLVVNVIAISPGGTGHAKLWADGEPEPFPSILNYSTGETTNDGLTVHLSPYLGQTYDLTWKSSAASSVVIDLVGWIAPSLETIVGNGTVLFSPSVLVVETWEGRSIKVFAPGEEGNGFLTDWMDQIPQALGNCVVIHGYWYNGPYPIAHDTFEARSLPIVIPGNCGPQFSTTTFDLRYSESTGEIWVPSTSTTDFSLLEGGQKISLGGQASQPGDYLVLEVDGTGKRVRVSPRPETATDQALEVTITSHC